MPLYEYQCATCGRFEVIRKFSDKALKKCPTCGKKIEKLASAPAFQFKGTGWYVTDYAKKSNGGGDKGDKKDPDSKPSDSGSKSEAGSSDKASADSSASEASDSKPAAKKPAAAAKKSSASGSSPT